MGQTAIFTVKAAGIPDAVDQWFKNGVPIGGTTEATLRVADVKRTDRARYTVTVTNASAKATSNAAILTVKEISTNVKDRPSSSRPGV